MKKLLMVLLFILCLLFFTFILVGCNYQMLDTNYKLDHVHIYETGKCYKIKTWRDFEDGDQLQVTLEDGTVLLLHSTDCALVHGDGCVFCKDKSE